MCGTRHDYELRLQFIVFQVKYNYEYLPTSRHTDATHFFLKIKALSNENKVDSMLFLQHIKVIKLKQY